MTDLERNKIRAMRGDGIGYRKIAAELNISRDSVRAYCKRIGLDGVANEAVTDYEHCKQCNNPIKQPPRGRIRQFCSEECRRSWWHAHPEAGTHNPSAVYKIVCVGCKQEFDSYGNRNRKYCSHSCFITNKYGGVI